MASPGTVRGAASWNSTPSLAAPPQVRCHGWHWRWSWLHATCAGNASMNARRGACVCHLQTSGWSRGRLIVCPRQALIEWFPDRKGLASSLAIAGFGSGALVFAPLMNNLSVRAVCTVAPGVSAACGQQVCVCVCGCVCVCVCVCGRVCGCACVCHLAASIRQDADVLGRSRQCRRPHA